jgi:hypothetical protein
MSKPPLQPLSSPSTAPVAGADVPGTEPLDIDLDTLIPRRMWVLPDPVGGSSQPGMAVEPRQSSWFADSTPGWLDSVPVPDKSDDAQLSRLDSSPLVRQVMDRFLHEDRKATQRVLAVPLPDPDSLWPEQERRRAVLASVQGAAKASK